MTALKERPARQAGGRTGLAGRHFNQMDGLRAVAALLVLSAHVAFGMHAEALTWYGHLFYTLRFSVPIFFAVSAFLLWRPYFAARWTGRPPTPLREYFTRRFVRIVPGYWVALTVACLMIPVLGMGGLGWLHFYGFVQIYSIKTDGQGMGVAWTLDVEVTFYLLLPLLAAVIAWVAARLPQRPTWHADVIVLTGLGIASVIFRVFTGDREIGASETILGLFDWFVPAMLLAVASVVLADRPLSEYPRALAALARRPGWCWAATLPLISLDLLLVNSRVDVERPLQVTPLAHTVENVLYLAIATLIVLPAMLAPQLPGWPRRFLAHRVPAYLGMISFGIYLYHSTLISWLIQIGLLHVGGPRIIYLWLVTVPLSVLAGTASWYLLERPLMRRFRSVGVRRTA